MLVQRTANYTLELQVGPLESMMTHDMDMGMAANHHVEVKVTQGDSGMAVMDLMPIIRFTDKVTGLTRDLPPVMGSSGSAMGPNDFHYSQNVFLSEGTYQVTVLAGPSDTAMFRDVVVMAPAMMAEHPMVTDMGMGHEMDMGHDMMLPEGTARDGRMFSQESAVTQALFRVVWGDRAAQEWVNQHNAAMGG